MEVLFHTGKSSEPFKTFAEKRVDFLTHELRGLNAKELKAVLHILKEENRTFDENYGASYNTGRKNTEDI